jgi:hypothetical protein
VALSLFMLLFKLWLLRNLFQPFGNPDLDYGLPWHIKAFDIKFAIQIFSSHKSQSPLSLNISFFKHLIKMFRKFHGLNISLEHQKSNKVQKITLGSGCIAEKD